MVNVLILIVIIFCVEKSNDSDDCDESRTERGKFVSERVTESNSKIILL